MDDLGRQQHLPVAGRQDQHPPLLQPPDRPNDRFLEPGIGEKDPKDRFDDALVADPPEDGERGQTDIVVVVTEHPDQGVDDARAHLGQDAPDLGADPPPEVPILERLHEVGHGLGADARQGLGRRLHQRPLPAREDLDQRFDRAGVAKFAEPLDRLQAHLLRPVGERHPHRLHGLGPADAAQRHDRALPDILIRIAQRLAQRCDRAFVRQLPQRMGRVAAQRHIGASELQQEALKLMVGGCGVGLRPRVRRRGHRSHSLYLWYIRSAPGGGFP